MFEFLGEPGIPYQRIILSLSAVVFGFDFYLNLRQIPHLKLKVPPPSIAPYLVTATNVKSNDSDQDSGSKESNPDPEVSAQETFLKSQAYALDKIKFSNLAGFIDQIETWALLSPIVPIYFGADSKQPVSGISVLWNKSIELCHWWSNAAPRYLNIGTGEIPTTVFFVILTSLLGMVTSVPSSLYRTFVLEEKHGFNKQTLPLWVSDYVKTTVLSAVLGLPLVSAFVWIVRWAGEAFVQYVMILVMGIVLFMYVGYPYLIAPLFNKFRHLSDFPEYKEVKTRTESLASRIKFPLGRLWVIDGSKRSAHSNAFFFGLPGLTKHIVIYDTLLKQSTPSEVEAVLAHELGHWKLNHTVLLLITSQLQLLFSLSIFRFFIWNPILFKSFGFQPIRSDLTTTDYPILIGFLLAQNLFGPLNSILGLLSNGLSRTLEFQADKFALDLGGDYAKDLKWALVRISAENKATTSCDWLYSAFHHSHPTLPERLARLGSESTHTKKKN
ncbi:peptidase family M48-domain-containing protein [Phakopsora pachyrhizi]|nr:peptidase family M48-domain-containing protein [Phakopsora pachyrhizi]